MQCSKIRGMISNYALGDARVTEKLCVEVHITHCAKCREELEDLCELYHACDRMLAHPAPRDDFDGLMHRIHREEADRAETPIKVRLRWESFFLRAAATAAVLLVILFSAPLVRQTGLAMRNAGDADVHADSKSGKPVRVPMVTEPFVKRATDINSRESEMDQSISAGTIAAAR